MLVTILEYIALAAIVGFPAFYAIFLIKEWKGLTWFERSLFLVAITLCLSMIL